MRVLLVAAPDKNGREVLGLTWFSTGDCWAREMQLVPTDMLQVYMTYRIL